MRLPDRLNDTARRLMLAPVILFGFASIIATGGGDSPSDPNFVPGISRSAVGVSLAPDTVAVQRGETVTVRVDVQGLAANEGVSGYTIDLSEEASRIDITTTACPAGIGTLSCRDWTIAPRADSVPAKYSMTIRAAGLTQGATSASLTIHVIDAPAPAASAAIATPRLIVSSDGPLYVQGDNKDGQAGVGFWNACNDDESCLQPQHVPEYVRLGDQVWRDAVSDASVSIAVRGDGTVWAWGRNAGKTLGFSSDATSEKQIAPQQVPGLAGMQQVSLGQTSGPGGYRDPTFLALTQGGVVYAWGGRSQYRCRIQPACQNTATHEPRLVPIEVDSSGEVTVPLSGVIAVSGGSSHAGFGFALALRNDGSVWQWGGDYFVDLDSPGDSYTMRTRPEPVNGLPVQVRSIAVGSREHNRELIGFAVIAGGDGTVWTWSGAAPTPVQVSGLEDVIALDADPTGHASALRADGVRWLWRPGENDPQQLTNLPPMAKLGHGSALHSIAADCLDGGGSLWLSDATGGTQRSPAFGLATPGNCDAPASVTLTITRTGEGTIATDPVFANCGSVCEVQVPAQTAVRMRVTPAQGWTLSAPEDGLCSNDAMLILSANMTCAYTFLADPLPKTLSVEVSAGGRVRSSPAGIDCPGDCARNFPDSSTVQLSATTDPGYREATFGGDEDCADRNVTMRRAVHCQVEFVTFPVTPAPTGLTATPGASSVQLAWAAVTDGSVVSYLLERSEDGGPFAPFEQILGTIDSFRDTGISPGHQYTYRLTAINISGSSPPATVTTTVETPAFTTLTVQVAGPGSVSSSPAGISCGADCTENYPPVTNVTLVATANTDARFDGWGSACAGTAPSVMVTMDDNKTCTARFVDVSPGGWQTLTSDIATSTVRDLRSSVALDQSGLAYIAYLQTVGTQTRLTVRKEGPGFPLLTTFNSLDTWSATGAQLVIDPAGNPVIVFNVELAQIWAAQWDGSVFNLLRDGAGSARLNLTANDASRPRMARAGNTLVLAWMEANQIALRRYNLDTRQFDAGAFVPGPTNPFDIDLALDSNGLAVIAWSDGLLGERLQAIRETGPGTWTQLGGDIGVRPATSPMVMEFGIHVDTNNAIRLVWLEGANAYYLSVAQFDGAAWTPLPGRTIVEYFFHPYPVRSLSVNRNPALFAFAYEWDQNESAIDGAVAVRQLVGGQLTMVGSLESTLHPRVGHLSLAMNEADRATIAQSEYTPADTVAPFKLVVRRHVP